MTTRNAVRIVAVAALLGQAGIAAADVLTGQVVGIVTDASTGKPVAGATVTAHSKGWIPQSVTTDEKGYYVLSLLPPEHYALEITAPGYATPAPTKVTVMMDWRVKSDVQLTTASASRAEPPPAARVASR